MDTHKEFTAKQQIIFYVVSTLVVAVCAYFDFKNDALYSHNEIHTQSTNVAPVKKHLSSYEVPHSANAKFSIQLAKLDF